MAYKTFTWPKKSQVPLASTGARVGFVIFTPENKHKYINLKFAKIY